CPSGSASATHSPPSSPPSTPPASPTGPRSPSWSDTRSARRSVPTPAPAPSAPVSSPSRPDPSLSSTPRRARAGGELRERGRKPTTSLSGPVRMNGAARPKGRGAQNGSNDDREPAAGDGLDLRLRRPGGVGLPGGRDPVGPVRRSGALAGPRLG